MEESLGVPSEKEVEEITEKLNVLGSSSGWEDTGNNWCGRDSKPHCVDLGASLEGRISPRASWWVSTTWSHPRMFCISTLLPCILHITMCSAPYFLMGSEGRVHVCLLILHAQSLVQSAATMGWMNEPRKNQWIQIVPALRFLLMGSIHWPVWKLLLLLFLVVTTFLLLKWTLHYPAVLRNRKESQTHNMILAEESFRNLPSLLKRKKTFIFSAFPLQ